MKKLLSKKSTKIALCVVTLLVTVFYVFMLVRPVSTLGNYTRTTETKVGSYDRVTEEKLKFINGKKFKVTSVTTVNDEELDPVESEMWYFVEDRKFFPGSSVKVMTEEKFDELVKETKEAEDFDKVLEANETKVSAFKLVINEDTVYKNTGMVVFAIIGGIVELVLLAGTAYSVMLANKKTSKKRK